MASPVIFSVKIKSFRSIVEFGSLLATLILNIIEKNRF